MDQSVFDFRLKHFGIRQSNTAMKVGTDAIVLGAWAASLGLSPKSVLDIGTGTGIILLMLMQGLRPRRGVGIDIAECIHTDAAYNCDYSPWREAIELIKIDVLDYAPRERFDLIVSNPPYFDADGIICLDKAREQSRREQRGGLTLRCLMQRVSELLEPDGEFFLVTPIEREANLRIYAVEAMLRLSRRVVVYSMQDKPIRLLSAWKPLLSSTEYIHTECDEIVLRQADTSYTEQYKRLTMTFLLDEASDS